MQNDTDLPVLDIGSQGTPAIQEIFGFYHPSLKHTPTGLPFQTYAGYRSYLIVGKQEPRLLHETDEDKLNALFRQRRWQHISDLEEQLTLALWGVIHRHPLVNQLVSRDAKVVWNEPNRKLKPREKDWVKIVQSVISNL